ncbi:MAG: hypothetical protein LUO93_00025 [Methanomicrobiales archaeon]|nr:hypothetical protein [Methanomicrobiales archaeon]
MEARTLDITAGIVTLILFIILLLVFQIFDGYGYIFAFVLFIIILSVAGYFINEKIA